LGGVVRVRSRAADRQRYGRRLLLSTARFVDRRCRWPIYRPYERI